LGRRPVRPPESYTGKLKRQQIAEYGYRDKKLGDYEEDHLIPLVKLAPAQRAIARDWKTAEKLLGFPPDLAGWPAARRNTCRGTLVAPDKRAPGSVKLRTGGDSPRPGRRR
jgi:hypothetical protein